MSDQNPSQTPSSAGVAAAYEQRPPAAAAVAPPPTPSVDVSQVAATAAKVALDEKAKVDATSAAERARAALAAEQQAELERLQLANKEQTAKMEQWQQAAKKQAALNALPGMKQPDTFLSLVMPHVAINEVGQLTEESRAALVAWKTEHSYLFEAANPQGLGTTPTATAGHRPAAGEFSQEDLAMMRMIGVKEPGKAAGKVNPLFWKHNSIGKGLR
jgi:hypothetical protein